MRWMRLTSFVVWATCAATSARAQPRITFEDYRVVAEGITPGGQAVWLSVAHERGEWLTSLVRRDDVVLDEDADGAVSFAVEPGVPQLSVWAVVDLASGDYALAAPEGTPLREIDFPGNSVTRGPRGALDVLENRGEYLEVLLVRPGSGAWGLGVGDGGASDSDNSADGTIRAALDTMRPLAASGTAPAEFRAGDVVIVVAPHTMEIWAATLGGGQS